MRYTNNIIVLKDETVEKTSLEHEKNFYKNNRFLKMPRVISYDDPFVIERIYGRHTNESDYTQIIKNLTHLHESTQTNTPISEEDVRIEIYDKLVKRSKPYIHREYVNGIKIKTYEEAVEFMKHVPIPIMNSCIIHGDPHFDNIIVRDDDEMIFIDPRGYFGNNSLYGIAQYDIAKVHFSLSGYTYFEHMSDYSCTDLPIHEKAFDIDFFTHVLLCSIWLGNSHAYDGDKFDTSRHFALYIFTLFCIKYNI